jgi:hypothetical protein
VTAQGVKEAGLEGTEGAVGLCHRDGTAGKVKLLINGCQVFLSFALWLRPASPPLRIGTQITFLIHFGKHFFKKNKEWFLPPYTYRGENATAAIVVIAFIQAFRPPA